MDNSFKNLECELEKLVPSGLSDGSKNDCHALIDQLVDQSMDSQSSGSSRWFGTAAAAAVALGLGVGGGWYLGQERAVPAIVQEEEIPLEVIDSEFARLESEAYLVKADVSDFYVTQAGEVRQISREIEVTKEVVQHKETGVVVTVETTDHHVVDSVKSDF